MQDPCFSLHVETTGRKWIQHRAPPQKSPKNLNIIVVCQNLSESVLHVKHAKPQNNTSNHGEFPLRPHSDLSANLSCSSLASCGLLTNAAASFPCLMQYLHQMCYRASNPNCSLTVVKLSVVMLLKYNNHTIIIIISDNIEAHLFCFLCARITRSCGK